MKEIFRRYIFNLLSFYLLSLPCLMAQDTITDKPKSQQAQQYFNMAQEAFDRQDYPEALEHLNKVLQIRPGQYKAYYYRGMVREQLGKKESALTDYNIYLDHFPNDFEALFSRAVLRYALERYKQAKEDFGKLLYLPS